MIKVVVGLLKKDGKYFIAKRTDGNPEVIDKWEFVGGTVKFGESEEYALEREFFEEFRINVRCGKYLTENIYDYPKKTVDLRLYECEYQNGIIKMQKDHNNYKWISIDEFNNYEFAPADIALKDFVLEKYKN